MDGEDEVSGPNTPMRQQHGISANSGIELALEVHRIAHTAATVHCSHSPGDRWHDRVDSLYRKFWDGNLVRDCTAL
jgi:hypothetical protein